MTSKRNHVIIENLVAELSSLLKLPEWWRDDGSATNIGAIAADRSSLYGGYVLERCENSSGAVSLGALGLPTERVKADVFIALLRVAVYWARRQASV